MPIQSHAESKPRTFEDWLENYGAWDQLEKEYSQEKGNETPTVILKRAQVYLNLNSPQQALEIIEMTPSFADNATEAQRLWIGGQAHRAMGNLSKSVLWFSQATEFMNDQSQLKKAFKSEPELETVWMDVWLKLYWSYASNHTISRNAQQNALNRIGQIGRIIWRDSYWDKADSVLHPSNSTAPTSDSLDAPQLDEKGLPLQPFITNTDSNLIIKALASASLENFKEAHTYASSIGQLPVRFFWNSVVDFLQTGQPPETLSILNKDNYLKASAFWQGNIMAPYSTSRSSWFLGNPASGPWTKFRNNLLSMPTEKANTAIDNELGSMLISEQTASLLNNFKLALSMANGNFIDSSTTWNKINKQALPIALQLAGTLLFKEDLKNVLPLQPATALTLYPILTALSGAAGNDIQKDEAPFWISAPQNRLKSMSQRFPMDRLLLLAYWQQVFDNKPTDDLAKRAAYVFDETSFGTDCLLYLADQSVQAKKLQLGAFYLNRVDSTHLSPKHEMRWLDIKTRLELDAGRTDAALKTFGEMAASGISIPVMTRLRMALLYQQRRDFKAAQEQLMAMWNDRASMTTTLQAETLFWLGEGEHAMRNSEKALDYYLRLAWQYPQENIWALTAMYRASLIYEKQGKYTTAKRLLTTVVKQADRKEQREAAKARLSAIDKKMGKSKKSTSVLVYPF